MNFGNKVSALFLALLILDILGAYVLIHGVLTEEEEPVRFPKVEHFEYLDEYGLGEQHVETISNGVIVDKEKLEMLAHLINAEAGTEYSDESITDEMQLSVGSVVLNRVDHHLFPNTLEEVIFQPGQYSVTWNGSYEKKPSERAYKNAEYLLLNGSILPSNVVYQANFKQGKLYKKIKNVYFGSTNK